MELQITGKNMEVTPALRRYIERKLSKLDHHLSHITTSRVDITEEKTRSPQQQFVVRITVAGRGTRLHSEERGADLFKAIDRARTTMTRQMEHYKGKRYKKKGKGNSLPKSDFSEAPEMTKAPEVVKVKRFAIKPMSLTEAADQMELLGHDFFLFYNADAEEPNLLYRRKDGNYGLIEPELG